MNSLFFALNKEEFNHVSTATSAYQIWQTLQVNTKIQIKLKKLKFLLLCKSLNFFKMKEKEAIAERITRFTDITNSLVALGKEYIQVKMARKIQRAPTPELKKKITIIEKANDLSTLILENMSICLTNVSKDCR